MSREPGSATREGGRLLPPDWSRQLNDYVTIVAASGDGRSVAVTTAGGELHVLSAASGQTCFSGRAHAGEILAAAYSPQGELLATAGQDGYVHLFEASGEPRATLFGGAGWVEHLAWSADGRRLATTAGKTVRVWTPRGTLLWESVPGSSTLTGIAWDSQGRRLAACCHGGVRLFDGASGAPLERLPTRASLVSLAWSPDDAIIACGTQECSVRFWRLGTGKVSVISGFSSKPRALNFAKDGSLLAAAGSTRPSVWPFDRRGPEGQSPLLLEGHDALCTVLSFDEQGRQLATGGDDGRVFIWDPRAGATPTACCHLRETVTALAWARHGHFLLVADASGLVEGRQVA